MNKLFAPTLCALPLVGKLAHGSVFRAVGLGIVCLSIFHSSQTLAEVVASEPNTAAKGDQSSSLAARTKASALHSVLDDLLNENPRIVGAAKDLASADSRSTEVGSRSWSPSLQLTSQFGSQQYQTESLTPPKHEADSTSLRATQLLYDFGRSRYAKSEAVAVVDQSNATLDATKDAVLLDALTAHWSAVRAQKALEFSKQSEISVRNLTQIESSLVDLGKGYESNVLQAKVQLASAESRRIRAEGALDIADARVRAVFGHLAERVAYGDVGLVRTDNLPRSLDEAKAVALENNQQIKIGGFRSQAILQRITGTQSREFLPRLQLVAELNNRNNWDSTMAGSKVDDQKLMVQLTYDLSLGQAGGLAVDAVKHEYDASVAREADVRKLVEEQVTIAWRNLHVAHRNKETLSNQVRIAAKFFEISKAERQLGRRSLLDLLSAEVALISALSDLMATEADGAIAGLTLMQSMGRLKLESVEFRSLTEILPPV
jgi:adhesin transport system outer membrane protein